MTIKLSLPALTNVGAFLALLIYVWAVVGMALFGEVDAPSFSSIGASCYTMVRILTGDAWAQILKEMTNGNEKDALFVFAVIFMASFIVICQYIVLSIFIAIVLVNFTDEVLGQSLAEFADEEAWKRRERLCLQLLIRMQRRFRERLILQAQERRLRNHPLRLSNQEPSAASTYRIAFGSNDRQHAVSLDAWISTSGTPNHDASNDSSKHQLGKISLPRLPSKMPLDSLGMMEYISNRAHESTSSIEIPVIDSGAAGGETVSRKAERCLAIKSSSCPILLGTHVESQEIICASCNNKIHPFAPTMPLTSRLGPSDAVTKQDLCNTQHAESIGSPTG